MEQRYFTKTLWAAAVVIMAIGALGQDVLADKKLSTCELSSVIVVCGSKGFAQASMSTQVRAGVIETMQDHHKGRACYSIMREAAAARQMPGDRFTIEIYSSQLFKVSKLLEFSDELLVLIKIKILFLVF